MVAACAHPATRRPQSLRVTRLYSPTSCCFLPIRVCGGVSRTGASSHSSPHFAHACSDAPWVASPQPSSSPPRVDGDI
eukprot:scaffold236966_cov27-Tisochrysis_lutea.AAC.1